MRELKNWAFEQPIRYGGANLNGVTTGERGCDRIELYDSGLVCVRWSNGDELFVVGRAWGVGKSAVLKELAKAADAIVGKTNSLGELVERGPVEGETEDQIAVRMAAARDLAAVAAVKPKRDKDGKRIVE